jgi:hypothetical protein
MKNIMKRIVKCCCEQTTIEVDGDPEFYGLCHCDNCKRRTGSAFGVSAYLETIKLLQRLEKLTFTKKQIG